MREVQPHRKQAGDISELVGFQPVDEAVLLAEALLKKLLVDAVDVAKPLTEVTVVAAQVQTPFEQKFCANTA